MSRLAAAVALLALAVMLALLGLDARAWDARLAADDARFESAPASEGLWSPPSLLPGDPAGRALGLGDDVAYRDALSTYARADPGETTATNPRREARRAAARRLLGAVAADERHAKPASHAAMLLGLLILFRGDVFATADEQNAALSAARSHLRRAIELDPANDDAKRNLELLLRYAAGTTAGTEAAYGSAGGSSTGAGRDGSGY